MPLHQTKQPIISHAVQVIVIVSSYGCLMDPYCKCIVRINLFSLSVFLFFLFFHAVKYFSTISLHSIISCFDLLLFFSIENLFMFPTKNHLFLTKKQSIPMIKCLSSANKNNWPSVNDVAERRPEKKAH